MSNYSGANGWLSLAYAMKSFVVGGRFGAKAFRVQSSRFLKNVNESIDSNPSLVVRRVASLVIGGIALLASKTAGIQDISPFDDELLERL